ncbi:helix-turn-helix domain-containing protein [Paenibacillus sp. Marseille-Q4541]|uniref:sigma factor-like helix-turn-helix DNA-binding protein n=1 Tax=Paenibacillus sp. Marseille-Q4541 TaxID=2831522 RepID=UPI001BA986AE|nr:helix-turn-helix domain-containing protein [Paenibacillus sp. Marseille-Q4541]
MEKNIKYALEDGSLPKYKARNILARQLAEDGKSTKEIAEILGVSIRTVQRHLKMMPDIHDPARRLPGNNYKLSGDQMRAITTAISSPPTESGFLLSEWTTHMLQQYIWDEFEIIVSREKARQLLQSNCSTTKQIPSECRAKDKDQEVEAK